jgi:formylglycine-generating enzyme required for sulfatase activity
MDNSNDRTWPVGSLKPNDWGLFDMLGNALEWTHEPYVLFPQPAEQTSEPTKDTFDDKPVTDTLARMLRGGAFNYIAPSARSAYRYTYPPTYRLYNFGFRVARHEPGPGVETTEKAASETPAKKP